MVNEIDSLGEQSRVWTWGLASDVELNDTPEKGLLKRADALRNSSHQFVDKTTFRQP
jgi:hypothetical protein